MSQMYRKLIDFFQPALPPQIEPLPTAGTPAGAEFDWPPSDEDLDTYSVVRLRADDGSEMKLVTGRVT